jgi:hypothetical protein
VIGAAEAATGAGGSTVVVVSLREVVAGRARVVCGALGRVGAAGW